MEDLSSKLTFFYKFVFPTMWIGMFALGTLLMFVAPDSFEGDGDLREMRWLFLGATLVGTTFIYWACMRVKRVSLANREFVISDYRQTIRVPIRDVRESIVDRYGSGDARRPKLCNKGVRLKRVTDIVERNVMRGGERRDRAHGRDG